MDPHQRTHLSKALALALRHKPWLFELELDEQGWTPLEPLLAALQLSRSEWKFLSEHDLQEVVETSDKQRYQMDAGRIRALYGHSIPGRIAKVLAKPPAILYHGTPAAALIHIQAHGLRPMSRQYVHLAIDIDMAVQVGRRKGSEPIVLWVEAEMAFEHGVSFYRGNELVWLADHVPPDYIRVEQPKGKL
jgi:putative RNA 2'-phosphotransferase